jgi:hypothetical protein
VQTVQECNDRDERGSLVLYLVFDPYRDFADFGWRALYGLPENPGVVMSMDVPLHLPRLQQSPHAALRGRLGSAILRIAQRSVVREALTTELYLASWNRSCRFHRAL